MARVHVVVCTFESCVASARVIERRDGMTIEGLLYSPTLGRVDCDELAQRESAALEQTVTLEAIEAEFIRAACESAARAA